MLKIVILKKYYGIVVRKKLYIHTYIYIIML
jgi:hypothetical protein